MPYRNDGVGPTPPFPVAAHHLDTPPEDYDLNFCFAVKEKLEAPGILLEPFIPSVHGRPMWSLMSSLSQSGVDNLFSFLPCPAPTSLETMLTLVESLLRTPRSSTLFVIQDTSRGDGKGDVGERIAGWIALINASADDYVAEVGHVVILPRAQRSHVTTNSIAALLKWSFLPAEEGGLGLRRVQYCNHSHNVASTNVPPRFGFHREGLVRCHRRLPANKPGDDVDPEEGKLGHAKEGKSRDTVLWAMTWKDWRDDGEGKVKGLLEREVKKKEGWPA